MTPQIPPGISRQHQHQPSPFFEHCDATEIFVVLAESLNDTTLTDPETNENILSVRQRYSANGLCFAREITSCAPGLYWALVSAAPDSADAERVMMEEEDLCSALPWDVCFEDKSPDSIRRVILGSPQEVCPTQPSSKCSKLDHLLPTPSVPLVRTITIGLSTSEIERAFKPVTQGYPVESSVSKPASGLGLQQGLLRAVLKALKQQLTYIWHQPKARSIQARCSLVKRLQHWQRQTHQRVVNVARGWCEKRHCVVWLLTIGVPEPLLTGVATLEVV